MIPSLSPNTQAILLLTAPLIVGRSTSSPDLLSPTEYKRLARHLREIQRQPADLVLPGAAELLQACQPVIDEARLHRLLGRGFLLSQVIERWQARAIWVVSRADADYPRRLKARLREDAPAVLYGCGDITLLETGGLAVVGSRHIDDSLIDYTIAIGRLSAKAGKTLVSGGAKGVDQAAMRGALEAGGRVSGVLADSLEKTAMNREHRDLLIEGQLVLISPYDPSAGFNVGNAMQRNKLIYALADASLVVSSDFNKGGTWAGAIEQLDKLRLVPVYVRSTGETSKGLDAIRQKGALPWPNPQDTDAFAAVFDVSMPSVHDVPAQSGLPLLCQEAITAYPNYITENLPLKRTQEHSAQSGLPLSADTSTPPVNPTINKDNVVFATQPASPADALFTTVRDVLSQYLRTPMKDAEVAALLQVSTPLAKTWLQRLVDEGVLEKQKRPVGYIVKQTNLFE